MLIDRLMELKNNSLYHFYNLIHEEHQIENKEEEENPPKNFFKTNSTTFFNEDFKLNKDFKSPDSKNSFSTFKKFFFTGKKISKKLNLIDSESKTKVKLNNNSNSNLNSNIITMNNNNNNSEIEKFPIRTQIEAINKFEITNYRNKSNNINNFNQNIIFGNFKVGKNLKPRLKLYNNIINKLVSEKDSICSKKHEKLHNFDMLAMDKFIENTQTEKDLQKNPIYTKYFSNYYDYINSDSFKNKPINLRYKSRKKVILLDS